MDFKAIKYDGLELSPEFARLATEDPQKILDCCNGVGSEVGLWGKLTYHFIPNTIWFLDITPCSDIHDVDYCYPSQFKNKAEALAHKADADLRIRENMETLICEKTKWEWLKCLRLERAMNYYCILRAAGEDSFLEGKTFEDNSSSTKTPLIIETVIK